MILKTVLQNVVSCECLQGRCKSALKLAVGEEAWHCGRNRRLQGDLCYRTVVMSYLSLTLVYCGQTVG